MPAPGGKHKGAASSSTGYAGSGGVGGKPAGGSMGVSGGKMGAGSSQSGGVKSSGSSTGNTSKGAASSGGGKMGASSSQSGGVRSGGNATGGMGSRSANAATGSKGYGGGNAGGKMGAGSSQTGGVRSSGNTTGSSLGGGLSSAAKSSLGGTSKSGPGGAGGVRNTSLGTRASQTAAAAAANNRTTNTLAAARATGLVPTPRTHPFRDPTRFNYPQTYADTNRTTELQRQALASGLSLPDQLAQGVPARNLSMLANLQSAWGRPLPMTSVASQFHAEKSQHHGGVLAGTPGSEVANAFDVDITGGPAQQAKFGQLAQDMGFRGIGTYDSGRFPGMVHVDARSKPGAWGSVAKAAVLGRQPSEPDMAAIAARVGAGSPTFGSLGPALAQPANPSMPALASANAITGPSNYGGFPSAQPSTFPGRPSPQQSFASQIAGRPDAQSGFMSQIAGRPQPDQTFNSQIAGRPEQTGLGFPAAFRSDFPARPAPSPGFASQVAGRPGLPNGFMSQIAGMPATPAPTGFPGAPVTDNFPGRPGLPQNFQSQIAGRPDMPNGFMSQIAGRPGLPNGFMSQIAGRPEQVGPGFPAAQPPQQVAAAPQQQTTEAPPSPGLWGDLQNPQGGLLAAQDDSGWLGALMGATGIGVGRDSERQGGDGPRLTGREDDDSKEKEEETTPPLEPGRLPWETGAPTGGAPMPFVPPQLVRRDRPMWSWGLWS